MRGTVRQLLSLLFPISACLSDQASGLCLALNVRVCLVVANKHRLCFGSPVMADLQYRTCKHDGEKSFDQGSRVLTYRGNAYRTRVFEAQISAFESVTDAAELLSSSPAL